MVYNAVLDVQFFNEDVVEPVTTQEISTYLKLNSDVDISLAIATAKRARQMCERYANISIMYRTVKAIICNLQGGILLPYGPVVNSGGIIVKNKSGQLVDYELSPKLTLAAFLNLISPCENYLYVEYSAGYAFDDGQNANYPQWAKQAILQQTAYLWGNRGDESFGMSNMAKTTLEAYKRVM